MPPSEALGQLTSCVISANAPSMSRLLNAEYACSIMVLVSAIHPPITFAMHSIIVMRKGFTPGLRPLRHRRLRLTTVTRSEEHTSELQSLRHLVCRLLLQ